MSISNEEEKKKEKVVFTHVILTYYFTSKKESRHHLLPNIYIYLTDVSKQKECYIMDLRADTNIKFTFSVLHHLCH